MYNVGGQIGGDSDLSPQGWKYAQALPALIKENVGEDANLEVCSPSSYTRNSADP